MNYYHEQVISIRSKAYPPSSLCRKVAAAKKLIDEHFAEQLDLDRIARASCCSRYYFLRLFKQLYGRTPHQYLTDVRLARAIAVLKTGSRASEVCVAVGFESTNSFKSLFKRRTGLTPFNWQQLWEKRSGETKIPLPLLSRVVKK